MKPTRRWSTRQRARDAAVVGLSVLVSIGACTVFPLAGEQKGGSCPKGERRTEKGCTRDPQPITKTAPEYPAEARKRGVDGSVTLEGSVSENGSVTNITVLKSFATELGYEQQFEKAAVAAFQSWRYRPGTIDGQAVSTRMTVTIGFSLAGQR